MLRYQEDTDLICLGDADNTNEECYDDSSIGSRLN